MKKLLTFFGIAIAVSGGTQTITNFGVLPNKSSISIQVQSAKNLEAKFVRDKIILSTWNGVSNPNMDTWDQNGQKVLLNIINNNASTFAKDLVTYESNLRSVLSKYHPEVVAVENKELRENPDTKTYRGSLQDYINELKVAVKVCNEKSLQVTNGGLTNQVVSSLYNYYITNNKSDSAKWLTGRMEVSKDPGNISRADNLLDAYKQISLSFVNLHWYEANKGRTDMTDVLPVLINYITMRTGKSVITNETGVRTNNPSMVTSLMTQWENSRAKYAIFYDSKSAAVSNIYPLTTEDAALLENGVAFKEFNSDAQPDSDFEVFTNFGVLPAKRKIDDQLVSAENLTADHVRDQIMLSQWNGTIIRDYETWVNNGYKVLLNVNNDFVPSAFPTNLVAYEQSLRSLLSVYQPEMVVIENEELNENDGNSGTIYHTGSIQDYINELTVAVRVCKEKGLPVTNGGITSPIIQSLYNYYTVNNKTDSARWLSAQMNGVAKDPRKVARVDSLLNAYRQLDLTYVNLHWYEPTKGMTRMTGVLQVIINYVSQQTGKKVISNETGVKTDDSTFVTELMKQWDDANTKYAIFYDSRDISSAGAYPLTNAYSALVKNGIAFKNYNQNRKMIVGLTNRSGTSDEKAWKPSKRVIQSNPSMKIYPNPVSDALNIEGLNSKGNTTLSILNMAGNSMYRIQTRETSYRFHIKQLPRGAYFLEVQNENGHFVQSFIKQ